MRIVLHLSVAITVIAALLCPPPASAGRYERLQKHVAELEARVAELESGQSALDSRLAKATPAPKEKVIAQLQARIEELESRLEQLSSLEHDVDQLSTSLEEIEAKAQAPAPAPAMRVAALDLEDLGADSEPAPPAVEVLTDEEGEFLAISGFGDLVYEIQQETEGNDAETYNIGQAELDLESTFDPRFEIAAAIAFDAEGNQFGLGAFSVDFHIFGNEEDHFHSLEGVDHSGLIVGQFDIPFGIDWQLYPSIDRRLVSTPLVVENTHGGWNDLGVQGYLESGPFNAVAYFTNGFEYEEECAGLCANPIDLESGRAFGGRLGLKPSEAFEIGGSYSYLPSREVVAESDINSEKMTLFGADVQIHTGDLSLRGEYIAHGVDLEYTGASATPLTESMTHSGFYTQAMYEFDEYFLIARYDNYSPDEVGAEDQRRLSAGAGWVLRQNCELRMEYQANREDSENLAYVQVAVGF